jgi:hypothetical protein
MRWSQRSGGSLTWESAEMIVKSAIRIGLPPARAFNQLIEFV